MGVTSGPVDAYHRWVFEAQTAQVERSMYVFRLTHLWRNQVTTKGFARAVLAIALIVAPRLCMAQRQMEQLGRGLVALHSESGDACVQWRLLATDPPDVAFNLYRMIGDGEPVRVNAEPISGATHVTDGDADPSQLNAWYVRPVVNGREQAATPTFVIPSGNATLPYLSIPIAPPDGYHANDASVGDLDGDGEYEIVVHLVGRGRDNSQDGETTEPVFDAYRLDGTRMWRINLGKNIREGAHYTQFMVYDLDGDGRAEFACKTADGTVDGRGTVIGDASADHRNEAGRILDGPEFLTVFDGLSGAALATVDYIPPRGDVARGVMTGPIVPTAFSHVSRISTASGQAWSCAAVTTHAAYWPRGIGATASCLTCGRLTQATARRATRRIVARVITASAWAMSMPMGATKSSTAPA